MQTSDPGHLFQTDIQLNAAANHERKLAASEKIGNPISVSSKILDFVIRDQDAWTAESGWQARRVNLISGQTKRLYKGHKGPVTSVELLDILPTDDGKPWLALFTGSWDKYIKIWDADTGDLKYTLEGHSDFVKSLTIIPSPQPVLLSTSSDRTLRIWDLTSLKSGQSPICVQTIKEHTRPVECAAWWSDVDTDRPATTLVWTGDSMGVIKQWEISSGRLRYVRDMSGHETSIAQMAVTEEGVWTVSMDNTALFRPFNGEITLKIQHPRYVKSVLPLPGIFPGRSLTLTGSEDEDLRLWNEDGTLVSTIQGHCGEVTRIRCWIKEEENLSKRWVIVSASLDGTLRRWELEDLLHPPLLDYQPVKLALDMGGLTEEEERELEDMMSDDT